MKRFSGIQYLREFPAAPSGLPCEIKPPAEVPRNINLSRPSMSSNKEPYPVYFLQGLPAVDDDTPSTETSKCCLGDRADRVSCCVRGSRWPANEQRSR